MPTHGLWYRLRLGMALATLEWARQWPCEEIWKARKLRNSLRIRTSRMTQGRNG
jgi:hypothetical protein